MLTNIKFQIYIDIEERVVIYTVAITE